MEKHSKTEIEQNIIKAFQDKKEQTFRRTFRQGLGHSNFEFSFVTPGTARYWLKERKPIVEFTVIGDTYCN